MSYEYFGFIYWSYVLSMDVFIDVDYQIYTVLGFMSLEDVSLFRYDFGICRSSWLWEHSVDLTSWLVPSHCSYLVMDTDIL